ncbi:MAG: CDP-glycerol glycerophosphotransferase family protein [Desulfovibrio sp.]|jgi:CDP-glycerol glycerophosphotransferase (TagB/SpsB family)|nr:CDP-glycerol glycerophosphotransferase family protein [Desulfovibrio sp.]
MRKNTGFSFAELEKRLSAEARRALDASLTPEAGQRYGGCLLFMDRPHKADDNAEHLYRWCRGNTPRQNQLYFVLAPDSVDWKRLAEEGFNLLPYRRHQHLQALFRAAWLISSHIGKAILAPAGICAFWLYRYKFAFLQHGVVMGDLADWLNRYRIDLLVASAQREYDSIINGGYKVTAKEAALAGIPRHDALLQKAESARPARNVLFCPTWRMRLQQTEDIFLNSDYFTAWNALLNDPALNRAALESGSRLLFLPHPQFDVFLRAFTPGPAFSAISWNKLKSIQDLLVDAAMMVTDYSSIAMDFALLNRPILYYQFDETPPFFQEHLAKPGYFHFDEDGFGPVTRTVEDAASGIIACMKNGFAQHRVYADRAATFFALRDGQNCRRVWEEILLRS